MADRIAIGEASFDVVVPDDLGERLLQTAGVSAAEMHRILGSRLAIAGTVAAALLPLLAEPLAKPDLARLIAEAGLAEVRDKVRRLYRRLLRGKAKPRKEATDGATQAQG